MGSPTSCLMSECESYRRTGKVGRRQKLLPPDRERVSQVDAGLHEAEDGKSTPAGRDHISPDLQITTGQSTAHGVTHSLQYKPMRVYGLKSSAALCTPAEMSTC